MPNRTRTRLLGSSPTPFRLDFTVLLVLLVLPLLQGSHGPVRGAEVSPERCLVWGPGLDPEVVVPVRFFFIQAVGPGGQNLTSSPGKDTFQVKIRPLDPGEHVRIQAPPPLDRGDGSFLMRYRLYGSVRKGLKVSVLLGDAAVARSPYDLQGPVYHEYCNCPEPDVARWTGVMQCPPEEPQVRADFEPFPSVRLENLRQEVPGRFSQRGGLIHYAVVGNRVFRRTLGRYTDFKMFSDEMLLSLTRKVPVPDVEFFLNVGDWPLETRWAEPQPILSWCGSAETRDIVLPTYEVTHSTLEAMRGVTNDLLAVQGHAGPPWENKTERAFFRGRDSREERLLLATLSRENPELLDAAITAWFFFREREKELGRAPLVGFFDFFKFKYQVSVDGTVAAYRLPYLLLGGSLVLKQDSPYYEFFYSRLAPGTHFLPVKRDLSDLLDRIRWARDHDAAAAQVARAGRAAARELLQPTRLYCYYLEVLRTYAALQVGTPSSRGMEEVPQPTDPASHCDCQRAGRHGQGGARDEL